MKMSVREARANFASAIEAAEKGEHVIITRNGKPVAELGPPRATGFDWDRAERVRKELGLDRSEPDERSSEQWLEDFNDPALLREIFGPEYSEDQFEVHERGKA